MACAERWPTWCTGRPEPTSERVARLFADLAPSASRVGCSAELADAHALLAAGGEASGLRAIGAERGPAGLTAWLAERFVADEAAHRRAASPQIEAARTEAA